jgi:hypothetical protein
MENHYLYISKRSDGKIEVNSSDGVFSSYATVESKEAFRTYCEGKVNEWLKSKVGNYSSWNTEKRKIIANKWLKARNLSEGKYDYYFTTESKEDMFRKEVNSLAKNLGIKNYTLEIKLHEQKIL